MISLQEESLRATTPVYINSFNQLTYIRDSVDWFAQNGFQDVTVLDNQSSYPPLLDYLGSAEFQSKAKLIRLEGNLGPRRALVEVALGLTPSAPFVFTDPDLLLPTPPRGDLLTHMLAKGAAHQVYKVGLALDLSDRHLFKDPASYQRGSPVAWEKASWKDQIEPGVYRAAVDTTFFLRIPDPPKGRKIVDFGLRQARIPSVRLAGEGLTAKHRPWYADCGQTAEELAYYEATAERHASWLWRSKSKAGAEAP